MSNNQEFLYDAFKIYFNKGIKAKEDGNISLARSQLLLAAETLDKLAAESTGELRRTRKNRVLKILDTVEALSDSADNVYRGNTVQKSREEGQGDKPQGGGGKSTKKEDTETDWQSAEVPKFDFSKVAGLDDVKQAAYDMIINPLSHSDLYKKFRLNVGGGILMYGLPGTGKTTIAKAIAGEVGGKFYNVKCSDILSKWVGEAERNIKNLFEAARMNDVSIIFFDDFDSIGKGRNIGADPTGSRVLSELLIQMQGVEKNTSKLLVLAATNLPWEIDTALMRPGRFSKRLYIPLPDDKSREFLINREIEGLPIDKNLDIALLIHNTKGFSGADVIELVSSAKRVALNRDLAARIGGKTEESMLLQSDIDYATTQVRSSISKSDQQKLEHFMAKN